MTEKNATCPAIARIHDEERQWPCSLPAGHECNHVSGEAGNALCWADDGSTPNPFRIVVVRPLSHTPE